MPVKILSSDYLSSIGTPEQIPEDLSDEIVFVGRSNSGKSSLLNALCGRKGLAKVGANPGKTRTINLYNLCYRTGESDSLEVPLVDVPGYGFARRSRAEIAKWDQLLGAYFSGKKRIRFVVLVADCRRSCTDDERWFIERVQPSKLIIAATKTDKLKKNEQRLIQTKLAKDYKLKPGQIFPLALVSRIEGVEKLRERLLFG